MTRARTLGTGLGRGAWEGEEPGNETREGSLGTGLGRGAWEGEEPGNETREGSLEFDFVWLCHVPKLCYWALHTLLQSAQEPFHTHFSKQVYSKGLDS